MKRRLPLTPRFIIALSHIFFGVGCFVRPDLDLVLRGYAPFGSMIPWGVAMVGTAIVLLFARAGGLLIMIGSIFSAAMLLTVAILMTGSGIGMVPTANSMAAIGIASLLLFGEAFQTWLSQQRWFHRLAEQPPRWWKGPRGGA